MSGFFRISSTAIWLLYGFTALATSFLLFLVEPLIAKKLLPLFGGGPQVWTTCLFFFQVMLLAGYWYAHLVSSILSPLTGGVVHVAVLACAGWFAWKREIYLQSFGQIEDPTLQVLVLLALTIGLQFFVLASSAPLLQGWFKRATGREPYTLYALSNGGSALAVLSYPLIIEPFTSLSHQITWWNGATSVLFVVLMSLQLSTLGQNPPEQVVGAPDRKETKGVRLHWFAYSALPSSLLVGVTHHLSANLAPVPLLWMIPLLLYLATYIAAFSCSELCNQSALGKSLAVLLPPTILGIVLETSSPFAFFSFLHCLIFFVASLGLHVKLVSLRPPSDNLTSFYGWIALGGASGAFFSSLVAPYLFSSFIEYPLALIGSFLAMCGGRVVTPKHGFRNLVLILCTLGVGIVVVSKGSLSYYSKELLIMYGSGVCLVAFWFRKMPSCSASFLLGLLVLSIPHSSLFDRLLASERNFFGQVRVGESGDSAVRSLVHGTTLHGSQVVAGPARCIPRDYYWTGSPVAQVFKVLRQKTADASVGVVGLGAGALLSYRKLFDRWTVYELDPLVYKMATTFFSFIGCGPAADLKVLLGDGRLRLSQERDIQFDLLILDAFSSGAIPVHLLTVEALRLYRTKITAHGVLAFHISNNFLDLEGPLGAALEEEGLTCLIGQDVGPSHERERAGGAPSEWIVAYSSESWLDSRVLGSRWRLCIPKRTWTDDHSALVQALRLH